MESTDKVNSKVMKLFYSAILLLFSINCFADMDLQVSFLSGQIKNSVDLGKVSVEGIGMVSLVAHRNENQLVIHAQDVQGKAIGKAETVVGPAETPLYVITPQGLKKITIHWGAKTP